MSGTVLLGQASNIKIILCHNEFLTFLLWNQVWNQPTQVTTWGLKRKLLIAFINIHFCRVSFLGNEDKAYNSFSKERVINFLLTHLLTHNCLAQNMEKVLPLIQVSAFCSYDHHQLKSPPPRWEWDSPLANTITD